MNDLIPLGTGNSRFLKSSIPENITFAQLVQLLRGGTFPVDFNGLNPEGISQMGSVYSKGNVLPDDVCAMLGISTESEPKDAFSRLSGANNALRFLAKYVAAGNYQWICPKTAKYFIVIIGGGGGGGNGERSDDPSGGASGYVEYTIQNISQGTNIAIVVGQGGQGQKKPSNGGNGGSSSFNSITANGGEGGSSGNDRDGREGGQNSSHGSNSGSSVPPINGVTVELFSYSSGPKLAYPCSISPSMFLDESGLPISYMCAGGNSIQTGNISLPNGKLMSPGSQTGNVQIPTDCGAGGGSYSGDNYNTISGAKGADGGVFIYEMQEAN